MQAGAFSEISYRQLLESIGNVAEADEFLRRSLSRSAGSGHQGAVSDVVAMPLIKNVAGATKDLAVVRANVGDQPTKMFVKVVHHSDGPEHRQWGTTLGPPSDPFLWNRELRFYSGPLKNSDRAMNFASGLRAPNVFGVSMDLRARTGVLALEYIDGTPGANLSWSQALDVQYVTGVAQGRSLLQLLAGKSVPGWLAKDFSGAYLERISRIDFERLEDSQAWAHPWMSAFDKKYRGQSVRDATIETWSQWQQYADIMRLHPAKVESHNDWYFNQAFIDRTGVVAIDFANFGLSAAGLDAGNFAMDQVGKPLAGVTARDFAVGTHEMKMSWLDGMAQAGLAVDAEPMKLLLELGWNAGIASRWCDRVGGWTRFVVGEPVLVGIRRDLANDVIQHKVEQWAEQSIFVNDCAARALELAPHVLAVQPTLEAAALPGVAREVIDAIEVSGSL